MIKNNFIIAHSNHFRARVGQIKYIIIHCSTKSPEGILSLCNKLGLSAHYIIGRDGKIARSIRTIVKSASAKTGKRFIVKIGERD